jgi:hypothetical protein
LDNEIVWEFGGPDIATVIWEAAGEGFTLEVTGIIDEVAALAAAACKSIAVGGGCGAVGSLAVAWFGGSGLDLLSICSALGGKFSFPPAVVKMVMVCSGGSLFATIEGGSGLMFEAGRSC